MILRATALLLMIILCGCSQASGGELFVENRGEGISAVQVDIGGKIIEVGELKSHSIRRVTFTPVSDSALVVKYSVGHGEKPFYCKADVYVTNGLNQSFKIVLSAGAPCIVQKI